MTVMSSKLEAFYVRENRKYRRLRYIVTPKEAREILNTLFNYFNLKRISIKFQKKVIFEGEEVVGFFSFPEIDMKLCLKFEREELELLTVLHEFTHYLVYSKNKWGTYKIHGTKFYTQLAEVIRQCKECIL
jgi:predicted SprT family Zn-dependent metalloprotease